jgi:putative NADPH-quinone reductase
MSNILVLQGHPDPEREHLCHALADAYTQAARRNGHTVDIIDVATRDLPFLRSKAEWESATLPEVAREGQAAITKAEHIVLIYPLWMGDMPAVLKVWIEQVLREGFAFHMGKRGWRRALKGKSARVIVTMGMPGFAYRWFYMAHSLRSLDRNILKFCGIAPVRWSIFGNAEDPSGRTQRKYIRRTASMGAKAG